MPQQAVSLSRLGCDPSISGTISGIPSQSSRRQQLNGRRRQFHFLDHHSQFWRTLSSQTPYTRIPIYLTLSLLSRSTFLKLTFPIIQTNPLSNLYVAAFERDFGLGQTPVCLVILPHITSHDEIRWILSKRHFWQVSWRWNNRRIVSRGRLATLSSPGCTVCRSMLSPSLTRQIYAL